MTTGSLQSQQRSKAASDYHSTMVSLFMLPKTFQHWLNSRMQYGDSDTDELSISTSTGISTPPISAMQIANVAASTARRVSLMLTPTTLKTVCILLIRL